MTIMTQNIFYTFLAIMLYLSFTWLASTTKPIEPVGILLPSVTDISTTTIPTTVQVLSELPLNYKQLGHISMMSPYEGEDLAYERLNDLVDVAREKAATIGANAIVVDQYGYTPQQAMGVYALEARAVFIDSAISFYQ